MHLLQHRDLPGLPADPDERRIEIQWLMDHRLWTHEYLIKMPPEDHDICDDFVPSKAHPGCYEMIDVDETDWPLEDVREGCIWDCVDIAVVYVDSTTERIEDDATRNTAFRVWLEGGGWHDESTEDDGRPEPEGGWNKYNKWIGCHDVRLDCGAADLETALLILARLVRFYYNDDGTDRADAPEQCEGNWGGKSGFEARVEDYVSGCEDAGDGFCVRCGFRVEDED